MPPELQAAFTRPEVITMLVTAILGILGMIAAGAGWITRLLTRQLTPIAKGVAAATDQLENDHGPQGKDDNLRSQLDRIESKVDNVAEDVQAERAERQMDERQNREEHTRIWKAIEAN